LHFTFDEADRYPIYREAPNRVPIYDLGNHNLERSWFLFSCSKSWSI
jgi:hypothetical protein